MGPAAEPAAGDRTGPGTEPFARHRTGRIGRCPAGVIVRHPGAAPLARHSGDPHPATPGTALRLGLRPARGPACSLPAPLPVSASALLALSLFLSPALPLFFASPHAGRPAGGPSPTMFPAAGSLTDGPARSTDRTRAELLLPGPRCDRSAGPRHGRGAHRSVPRTRDRRRSVHGSECEGGTRGGTDAGSACGGCGTRRGGGSCSRRGAETGSGDGSDKRRGGGAPRRHGTPPDHNPAQRRRTPEDHGPPQGRSPPEACSPLRGSGSSKSSGAPGSGGTGQPPTRLGPVMAGGGTRGHRPHGDTRLGAAPVPLGGRASRCGPRCVHRCNGASSDARPGCVRGDRRGPWRPDDRGVRLGPSPLTHHVRARAPFGPQGPARHRWSAGRRPAAWPVPLPSAMPPLGVAPRQELPGSPVPAPPQHAPQRPVTTTADLRDSRTGERRHGSPATEAGRTTTYSSTDETSRSEGKLSANSSRPHDSRRTRGSGDLGTRSSP